MNSLASRLKAARTHAQLTQAELENRSGVKQQMISKLESGKSTETSKLVELAMACGVRPEWLATGAGPMVSGAGHRDATISQAPPDDAHTAPTPAAGIGERSRAYAALSAEDEALLNHYHHLTPKQRQELLDRMREQARENLEVLEHLGRKTDQ